MCILKSIFRMEKFKTILLIIITNLITAFTFSIFPMLKEEEKKDLENDNLAVFVETSDGSGEYTLSSMSGLPTDRKYIYNSEKSSCINGGVLTWNDTTRKLSVTVTSSDTCNTYFNIDETGPIISKVEVTDTTQTSITVKVTAIDRSGIDKYYYSINDGAYISSTSNTHTFTNLKAGTNYNIKVYVADTVGNNSSVHNSNKTTTALVGPYLLNTLKPAGLNTSMEGGLYRFQGATGNVNNFICFGTTDKTTCTQNMNKYMYRIIGIDSLNQLKLIKKNALSVAYNWNTDFETNITWSDSELFSGLNDNYFLNNTSYIESLWKNKILTKSWKYGDVEKSSDTANNIYQMENSWSDTVDAKIGLMFLHDYYYAYQSNGLNCAWNGEYSMCQNSWLQIKQNDLDAIYYSEWTMTRAGKYDGDYGAWYITSSGYVEEYYLSTSNSVRPVFYLTTDVSYLGGTGTIEDPIMIE